MIMKKISFVSRNLEITYDFERFVYEKSFSGFSGPKFQEVFAVDISVLKNRYNLTRADNNKYRIAEINKYLNEHDMIGSLLLGNDPNYYIMGQTYNNINDIAEIGD